MRAIGGYFELELGVGVEYHKEALRLNTGRNAFEYILRAKAYKRVYIPYYTCDVLLEPMRKLSIDYRFYHIDADFRPIFNYDIVNRDEVFLYTNYYGVCRHIVEDVRMQCENLIIDNSQAFYDKSLAGVDTFYSARKFFGTPDGAYLYTDKILNNDIERDTSYQRMEHLLKRIDLGAEQGYADFKQNDDSLINNPIRTMSELTRRLLSNIDYEGIKERRRNNFIYLHAQLSGLNRLNLNLSEQMVPMVYPLWIDSGSSIKQKLLSNRIFVATYWPNVLKWCDSGQLECELVKNLLPLPIDQRLSQSELERIIKFIK